MRGACACLFCLTICKKATIKETMYTAPHNNRPHIVADYAEDCITAKAMTA